MASPFWELNTSDIRECMFVAFYSVFLCLFTIATAIFDLYCYGMAVAGFTHEDYFNISLEFIHVPNIHVMNCLIVMALLSLISAAVTLVTSIILISAIRKEHEQRMIPWLRAFAIFSLIRLPALLLFSIVNDLHFVYNFTLCALWSIFLLGNVYGWALVHSLFAELSNLPKLSKLAPSMKFSAVMSSSNSSSASSCSGSSPTSFHSTLSITSISS